MIHDMQSELMDELVCPILGKIFVDPVITENGFTYEKKAIQEWLNKSEIQPVTGLYLNTKKLIPNFILKNLINKIKMMSSQMSKKHKALIRQKQKLSQENQRYKSEISQLKISQQHNKQLRILLQQMVRIQQKNTEDGHQRYRNLLNNLYGKSLQIQKLKLKIENQHHQIFRLKMQLELFQHNGQISKVELKNQESKQEDISANQVHQCIYESVEKVQSFFNQVQSDSFPSINRMSNFTNSKLQASIPWQKRRLMHQNQQINYQSSQFLHYQSSLNNNEFSFGINCQHNKENQKYDKKPSTSQVNEHQKVGIFN